MMNLPKNYSRAVEAKELRIAQILKLLSENEMSRSEIEKATGLRSTTINNYVGQLHADELVYISSYGNAKYGDIARYSVGQFPDVPRPPGAHDNRRKRKEVVDDGWGKPTKAVVKVWRDPYLWLTAGRPL